MILNEIIARLRAENKLSIEYMANLLHVCTSTYKRYEAGLRPIPLSKLNILSNYYKVSLDYLLGLTKYKRYEQDFCTINYNRFLDSIQRLRKLHGLRQIDLAKKLNLSLNTIKNYETKPSFVTSDFLYSIALLYNTSIDYLCGKSYEPRKIGRFRSKGQQKNISL